MIFFFLLIQLCYLSIGKYITIIIIILFLYIMIVIKIYLCSKRLDIMFIYIYIKKNHIFVQYEKN